MDNQATEPLGSLVNSCLKYTFMHLNSLIHEIESNPDQCRHAWSLSTLWSYLQGFVCSRSADYTQGHNCLNDFSRWVGKQFDSEITASADRFILLHAPNQAAALTRFFTLWHQFQAAVDMAPLPDQISDWTPQSISALIDSHQDDPTKYVADSLFPDLIAFLEGYGYGCQTLGFQIEDSRFVRFTQWITHKWTYLDLPWFRILEFFSADKGKLLMEFFAVWKAFKRVDDLLEELERKPHDRDFLIRLAQTCCESRRFEGVALIHTLLNNFDLGLEQQREWLIQQALLLEQWDRKKAARLSLQEALRVHQQTYSETDPMWAVKKRATEATLERLDA